MPRPDTLPPRDTQLARTQAVAVQPQATTYEQPSLTPEVTPMIPEGLMDHTELPRPKKRRWFRALIVVVAVVGLLFAVGGGAIGWYVLSLKPANSDKNAEAVSLEVAQGDTWSTVAKSLAQKHAIGSELAFSVYARLNGGGLPQATCFVSPADSAQAIVAQLASGCKDSSYRSITFYPGATIETPLYKPENSQIDAAAMSIKNILTKAGYSGEAIDAALTKRYSGELFVGKPAGATLEGYVYGQTYHISKQARADQVLQATFDQMLADLKKYDLINQYKQKHDLDLFQAITLASIVQRELNCEDKPTAERKDRCHQYQRSIAQVFMTRLKIGMTLGSDVTFIYAADQLGVQPSPGLESPYNTRIKPGLPPGPIASPGLLALRAVADPTPTDYLYFIAGDDGLIYFAKTDAEHQQNIKNHCQQLCSEL